MRGFVRRVVDGVCVTCVLLTLLVWWRSVRVIDACPFVSPHPSDPASVEAWCEYYSAPHRVGFYSSKNIALDVVKLKASLQSVAVRFGARPVSVNPASFERWVRSVPPSAVPWEALLLRERSVERC